MLNSLRDSLRAFAFIAFLVLTGAYVCAQTPIPVSGNFIGIAGAIYGAQGCVGGTGGTGCYVNVRLRNYAGALPRVSGLGITVPIQQQVIPSPGGAFSINLYGNDVIQPMNCGVLGLQDCTYYTFEFWSAGRMITSANWSITGTQPFNLNTAQTIVQSPQPPAPYLPILQNPNGNQIIQGYTLQAPAFVTQQYIDFLNLVTPANPAAGYCRIYYNLNTGTLAGINSSGGSCGPSGGGGTGTISGTPNYIIKFTGTNTGGNSCLTDAGGEMANVCSPEILNLSSFTSLIFPNPTVLAALQVTGNATVGSLTIASGVYQVTTTYPLTPLACPTVGSSSFGINSDGWFAECFGGSATPGDLAYIANAVGPGLSIVSALGTNPGLDEAPNAVDLYTAYGGSDLCAAIAAGKTAHLTDGVTLDGRSFGQEGTAIKCGVSTYVAGYEGQILLPAGTINVQGPNLLFLQTRSDVTGQGEDATSILACVSGNTNCNGVYFPTSATPLYPVVAWTDDGVSPFFNANPTFDTRLSKVTISCASSEGAIGLTNFVAQENESGPHEVSIHGCANHGIAYAFGGADIAVSAVNTIQFSATSTSTSCTNCSIPPLASAQAAGDTNVTCGIEQGTDTLNSIVDTANNGYNVIATVGTDGAYVMHCGYAQGVNYAAVGNTVTYRYASATSTYSAGNVAQFHNIASLGTLDQVAVATVTTANPTCPSITPTVSPQGVYVVCVIMAETTGTTYAVGTTSGCAASACTAAFATATQASEWAYQSTPAAITLNWTNSAIRRAIVMSMDFFVGTNNGPGSQNHAVSGLDLFVGNGDTSTADSLLISGDTGAIGIAGPKEVRNVTATVNQGYVGTAPTELIRISGTGMTFDNIHLENWQGANSYGFGLGEDAGFSGITINNLNAGNASSGTALLYLSAAFPSNSITITNLNEVGPNFSTDTIIDAINGFTDATANEPKLSLYSLSQNGCKFSGSSSGQCIVTTSGYTQSTFGRVDNQGYFTDYNCASQFGDGQAGSAAQYPCTFGFTTIPIGWQQIVVSTNAVYSVGSHVMIQDDPAALGYYGGFPSTCNTAQFLEFKILAKQGWNSVWPIFTEYPVQNVTSSALSSNVVTLTGTFSGIAVGNIIRHAGDATTGLNTLGWVTGGNLSTTLTYALIGSNTTGTGGTVQIVPGFVAEASSSVSTTAECLSFTIFD
jgi:hypothetical protein